MFFKGQGYKPPLIIRCVQGVSTQLKDSLMQSVEALLQVFVDRGEAAVNITSIHVRASGVLHWDGKAASQSSVPVKMFQEKVFSIVAMSPWMHRMNLSLFADVQSGYAAGTALGSFCCPDLAFRRKVNLPVDRFCGVAVSRKLQQSIKKQYL